MTGDPPTQGLGGESSFGGRRALVFLAAVGLLVASALTGFPIEKGYAQPAGSQVWPDVFHEVATAREALYGDPHRSLAEIMPEYGLPAHGYQGVSPRPPAAYLLQLPLVLIPNDEITRVATSLVLIFLLAIVVFSRQITDLDWRVVTWSGPLVFLSLPAVTAISYGSVSALAVVALILLAWRHPDSDTAGLAIGFATAWRLWPGLLIPALWVTGRRRGALLAAGVFVTLNLAGLMLPGVTLAGSVQGLIGGSAVWVNHNMNASLALPLLLHGVPPLATTALVSAAGLVLVWRYQKRAMPIATLAAVIASPLSWPSYALAALPVAFRWLAAGRAIQVGLVVAPAVLWFAVPSRWRGHAMLLVLVVGLVATVGLRASRRCGDRIEARRPPRQRTPSQSR